MKQVTWQTSDISGAARLATDAVTGVTSVVEAMHARIISLPRWPGPAHKTVQHERTSGITGWVYKSIRGITRTVGGGAEALVNGLGPLLLDGPHDAAPSPSREAVVAAVNGVVGDRLAASANPLAIAMTFRQAGRPLALEPTALRAQLPLATPKLLVLVHGLCMNDLQWQRAGHDHGQALAQALGYTPVYLHYNTGLNIATNGLLLSQLLERLCHAWPVPLDSLTVLGHSMGGLVARSAMHQAADSSGTGLRWPHLLSDLVCLGSPHHGAALERAGHGVDVLLSAAPYAAPLARLGQVRSAGITDLRWGNVVSAAPGASDGGRLATVPLPRATRSFALAASLGAPDGALKARLLGDGLVTVASALGQHRDTRRHLDFAADRQAVVYNTGHLDLLSSPQVFETLRGWLR